MTAWRGYDHNGECLDCDERADAHTPECPYWRSAAAASEPHIVSECGLPEDAEYWARRARLPTHCYSCGAYLRGGATEHKITCDVPRMIAKVLRPLGEEQRVALGMAPRTLRGRVYWLRYWSPIARRGWRTGARVWWRYLRRRMS